MEGNPELGRYIEQYEGQVGSNPFTVKVLRIGKKIDEQFLIQISGVDDEMDGKIYKYKKEWQNSDKSLHKYIYVTNEIPGIERYGFFHSNSDGWGQKLITIYLYDNQEVPIQIFHKENPDNLDPNYMYSQYKKGKV